MRDLASGEEFALKKINLAALSPEGKQQAKAEINLWREISGHKNIVQIHAVQQQGDDLLIPQDLC